MSKKVYKTVGEGGAHAHGLAPRKSKTFLDGAHKHIYLVNDRILMTDLSGAHEHSLNISENKVGEESPNHLHGLQVRTQDGTLSFTTSSADSHAHEMQVESTTVSGVHRHVVEVMGQQYVSLIPSDLIEEMLDASKSVKKFSNLTLESETPLELDFSMVKKMNQSSFKEILKKAVESSIIKRMTRLSEGLRIETLILSRERFADVGFATRFVLDQGLDIKASNVLSDEGLFTFQIMSRQAFEETTLQRIRITEGVEAVIGFLAEKEVENDGVTSSLEEMTDVQQSEEGETMSLKEKFAKTMGNYSEGKKSIQGKKPKKSKNKDEEDSTKFKAVFEFLKKNEDQRLVTGPVLIPENIDLQDDIVSTPEILKAAHGYMIKLAFKDEPEFLKELGFKETEKAGERGFMHVEFSRKAAVVETFLAPVDFELNGRMILKGTWVMTMKIFDDEIWAMVKTGKITGFSIGGRSKSKPEKEG